MSFDYLVGGARIDRPLPIAYGDTPAVDAFGRLRISNPFTLFDSKQLYDSQPLFWDDQEVSGGSTSSSHSVNTASTTIGVAATTVGKRVRQTFMRFNYQPGKSLLILMTAVPQKSGGGAGIISRFGYFDDQNGVFFKNDEGVSTIAIRSYVTGSAVDNEVVQASWNIDTLDGNGPSGITLDLTKAQIFFIDLEWLGVGRVRCGFVINGAYVPCHQFFHANTISSVYMSTPNLPLRYEIENDGTGAASTFETICSTVISEGGIDDNGHLFHASTGATYVDANSVGTIYAIIGLRLKTTALSCAIKMSKTSTIDLQNDSYEWLILWNPVVADTFTYNDLTNSCVQVAYGATANTVTGGTLISGGHVKAGGGTGQVYDRLDTALRLGAAIDGTRDTLVLCARPLGANADIHGTLTWRELV